MPSTRRELVVEFSGRIKRLVTSLVSRYPSDPMIQRIRKRVYAAADEVPEFIISEVGQYLYQYAEKIYGGDDSFFANKDYNDEIMQSEDQEKAEMVGYVIPKVKEAWAAAGVEEKESYKLAVQELLDVYMDYLPFVVSQR